MIAVYQNLIHALSMHYGYVVPKEQGTFMTIQKTGFKLT